VNQGALASQVVVQRLQQMVREAHMALPKNKERQAGKGRSGHRKLQNDQLE